jgi:hypothetical protein
MTSIVKNNNKIGGKKNVDKKILKKDRLPDDPDNIDFQKKYVLDRNEWEIKLFKEQLNLSINAKKSIQDRVLRHSIYRKKAHALYIHNVIPDTVDVITSILRVKHLGSNLDVIYAFVYRTYVIKNKKLPPSFVQTFMHGGSFLSMDGEYRYGMYRSNNLMWISKLNGGKLITKVGRYVMGIIRKRNWVFYPEIYYPTNKHKYYEIAVAQTLREAEVMCFMMAWLFTISDKYYNTEDEHINPSYKKLMYMYLDDDIKFLKELIDEYGEDSIKKIRYWCKSLCKLDRTLNNKFLNNDRPCPLKVGQKLIPINLSEIQNPFNIEYRPWKEYLVGSRVGDLVVNQIAPGFSITNRWFYIKNATEGLFDNTIQYDRMRRSKIAEQIANLLLRAKHYSGHKDFDKGVEYAGSDNESVGWLTKKFKELSNKINVPIRYAKDNVILSNVVLGILGEYVGKTILNSLILSEKNKKYSVLIGDPFKKGHRMFARYIFDICWNLLALNSRFNVIHGDLHLNNVTIHDLNETDISDNRAYLDKTQILYSADNQLYMLDNMGYYACVIDFSRCIINGDPDIFKSVLMKNTHALYSSRSAFEKIQTADLLNLYILYVPSKNNIRDELAIMFRDYFEMIFKLMTVVDIYGFTQRMILADKSGIKISPKNIELLKNINNSSKVFIIDHMNRLINDREFATEIKKMKLPMLTILEECFQEFKIKEVPPKNKISDVYVLENEMKYSLNSYDKSPPFITSDVPNWLSQKKANIDDRKKKASVRESSLLNNMKMINYIATRHKQKYV